ncbi:hypothetical protein ACIPX0_03375 [Streptomyces sp. NPDC090075]|uniref:hypothetical protein n=1 Tax=Streptomyces sp. NPDC090075 TaxID=3365937 RepID=UPI00380602CD
MIQPLKGLWEAWQDAFSWFVYPIRMPLLVVAWVVLIQLTVRWVLSPLGAVIAWTSPKVAWLVGTVLFAPEYAYTMRLIGKGAGIPLALRLYGDWAESVTRWTTASGRALGSRIRGLGAVSTRTACALVLVWIALSNAPALDRADKPDAHARKAPATIWWESFQAWLDDSRHPLWNDTSPTPPSSHPTSLHQSRHP